MIGGLRGVGFMGVGEGGERRGKEEIEGEAGICYGVLELDLCIWVWLDMIHGMGFVGRM